MEARPSYLRELNPEQKEAVEHFEGPLLVLAGAGSGKTRVLTTRVAHLVEEHGVDASGILAVTFTNKSAWEMRERIRRLLGREPAGTWIGTFHAIGARLLRRHGSVLGWSPNFSIYDADQSLREIKRTMERLDLSTKRWHPKAVQGTISSAKNRLIGPEEYQATALDVFSRKVAEIYPAYQAALREQNSFDFDDLLVKPVELFTAHSDLLERYRRRFSFLLVDEYQDTNHAQYRLLKLLSEEHGNLMVVGDDDQSIYRWRGADIGNILDFEHDFPSARVIRLERNYRSTGRILQAANVVIAENVRRKGKTLRTDAPAGAKLTLVETADERDEAGWICGGMEMGAAGDEGRGPRDFVVLYRTNAQSRALEDELLRRDLPYQVIGGTRFYERREIMDVLAYLRLISNPLDAGAFDRIVNYPRRGIGDVSRAHVLQAAAERGVGPLEAAAGAARISQLTVGAARALEGFAGMIERFRGLARHVGVGELLESLIAEIGVLDELRKEGPDGEDRANNVKELLASAHEFGLDEGEEDDDEAAGATPLDRYLQRISLVTDVDRHDPEAQAVSLMTLHNAKGLEFPVVFIAGLEDGLFPLASAFEDPEALEEERRLFYVGITRAKEKLFLSHARSRRRAGEVLDCVPSSFLAPLPDELIERTETPEVARARTRWGRWRDRYPARGRSPAGDRAADREDAAGGLVIDYSEGQDLPRFVKGERVRHPRFGSGIIRELSGFGLDLKVTVDFDEVGRKKVLVRYANLQKEL